MEILFVYFDLADTLIHKPELFPRLEKILAPHGATLGERELRLKHGAARRHLPSPPDPTRDYYDTLNAAFLELLDLKPEDSLLEELYQELKQCTWAAFDDTVILSQFSVPLGIASNWRPGVSQVVERFFPDCFSLILGSGDEGVAKPELEFFERAIGKLEVPRESILFIGDSPDLDIEPASSAGMQTLLLDRFGMYETTSHTKIGGLEELGDRMPQLFVEHGASDEC